MKLSTEEVKKIAVLARIKLTTEEVERHAETISAVLQYMEILNEIDTSAVEPTSQVTGLEGVFRADEVVGYTDRATLLAIMPVVEHDKLIVPEVFAS